MNKKKLPKAIAPAAASLKQKSFAQDANPESKTSTQDAIEESAAAIARAAPKPLEAKNDTSKRPTPDEENRLALSRRAKAVKLAKRFSLWSGVASVIPLPFVDVAAIGGVQIQMLRRISQIYDVPFSENRGKALVAGLAGCLIPATSVIGAASMMKGAPLVGTAVSTVTMPALSVGATYAIGLAFIRHFASGGTLLDFNPPDYREFIKAQSRVRRKQA